MTTSSPGTPTDQPLGPAGFSRSPFGGGTPKERLARLLNGYSRKQQMLGAGAVALVVVAVLVVVKLTSGTDWGSLYTDVAPSDGGAIVDALEEQGIPHKLANGGSTIMVPADMVYDTRLKLSDTDLPTSGKVGYGVLDEQGLTTSEFGQRVGYQRAMEGELSKTIEAIDAVDTAVVHLAIPENKAFALDEQKPSASVLVKTNGRGLSEDQVRAVVNLVASGIEGMSPDDVTVADSDGNVLAAPGQGVSATSAGGSSRKQTDDFEAAVENSLNDLLVSVVGPGGSKVSVTANLDFDQTTVSKETFEKPEVDQGADPLVVEESKRDETFTGGNPQASGVLGPDTPTISGTDSDSDYSLKEGDVRYALNRAVESTTKAPGQIEQMSVAVLVDQSKISAAQAEQLTKTLAAGANIREDRGDVLTVTRMPFDESASEAAQSAIHDAEARKAAETGGGFRDLWPVALGLILLGVSLFLSIRKIRARRRMWELDALDDQPTMLGAGEDDLVGLDAAATAMIESAESGDVLDLSSEEERELVEVTAGAIPGASSAGSDAPVVQAEPAALELFDPQTQQRMERESALGGLIDNQPEEVAALLRGWLADRRGVSR